MSLVQRYITNRFCRTAFTPLNSVASCDYVPIQKNQQTQIKNSSNLTGELIHLPPKNDLNKIETYKIGKNYRSYSGYTLKVIGIDSRTIEILANLADEPATLTHQTFLNIMCDYHEYEHMILYKTDNQYCI